jgi:hypothetical protein
MGIGRLVYCVKELSVCVIHRRCYTLALTYNLLTYRTGKEYTRNPGKLIILLCPSIAEDRPGCRVRVLVGQSIKGIAPQLNQVLEH